MPNTTANTVRKYAETLAALNLPDHISLPQYEDEDSTYVAILAKAIQMDLINILRTDEGDEVEIAAPNASFGGPNQSISCCGEWTGFVPIRFFGDTLIDCLVSAIKQRQAWQANYPTTT